MSHCLTKVCMCFNSSNIPHESSPIRLRAELCHWSSSSVEDSPCRFLDPGIIWSASSDCLSSLSRIGSFQDIQLAGIMSIKAESDTSILSEASFRILLPARCLASGWVQFLTETKKKSSLSRAWLPFADKNRWSWRTRCQNKHHSSTSSKTTVANHCSKTYAKYRFDVMASFLLPIDSVACFRDVWDLSRGHRASILFTRLLQACPLGICSTLGLHRVNLYLRTCDAIKLFCTRKMTQVCIWTFWNIRLLSHLLLIYELMQLTFTVEFLLLSSTSCPLFALLVVACLRCASLIEQVEQFGEGVQTHISDFIVCILTSESTSSYFQVPVCLTTGICSLLEWPWQFWDTYPQHRDERVVQLFSCGACGSISIIPLRHPRCLRRHDEDDGIMLITWVMATLCPHVDLHVVPP